jgi:hypothetical protein
MLASQMLKMTNKLENREVVSNTDDVAGMREPNCVFWGYVDLRRVRERERKRERE